MDSLVNFILPFLLLLGIVVFIHELGHFLVAKWFNVKVERLSLGFGPSVLRRVIGETEYVIAALPLGGYVKMLGELPGEELSDEDRERAVNLKPPWQRICISLAGPVMNMVLAAVVFGGMLMSGIPTPTTRIGAVHEETPAARAGLLAGDRIVAIEGNEISLWSDLKRELAAAPDPAVRLEMERADERFALTVLREVGADGAPGPIGVEHVPPAALVAVPDAESPAALAGLRTGDRVVAVNGDPVDDLYALRQAIRTVSSTLEIEVERRLDDERERVVFSVGAAAGWSFEGLGLAPLDFVVQRVIPTLPARTAGLQRGDVLLRVQDRPVRAFEDVAGWIRASGGKPLEIVALRAGRELNVTVTPIQQPMPSPEGMKTDWGIGLTAGLEYLRTGEMTQVVVGNPVVALWRGSIRTLDLFVAILDGLGQLITGGVALDNLAGPLGIAEIAADAYQTGWVQFLLFLAAISVNLAILNMLPIPVLDGGQIVLTFAEAVRGGPLPDGARDFAQAVGLSLIVLIMGFAFWNDISRNWAGILGFLKGLV
jgi:regulator of sigma E protease